MKNPERMNIALPREWKERFSHYYKLPKDVNLDDLTKQAEDMLWYLSNYLAAGLAKSGLKELRNRLAHAGGQLALSTEQRRDIDATVAAAEDALEARQTLQSVGLPLVLPGVAEKETEKLVRETLAQAALSLRTTSRVNICVLIAGALVIIASFVATFFKPDWMTVTFGGFGIVGIITTLITNPLKSIALCARRVIQVQVAYLSFLSQLAMLNDSSNKLDILERSKRLGEETNKIQQTLGKQFDE